MELTKSVFEPLVGETFDIPHPESGEVYTRLTLQSLTDIGRPHPGRSEPFSLIFHGSREAPLPQGNFVFRHPAIGDQHLFIVPIGEKADIREYQSIFN